MRYTHHGIYKAQSVCIETKYALFYSVATPELVMYVDRWGLTALHWAISYDHSHHLKLLLKL